MESSGAGAGGARHIKAVHVGRAWGGCRRTRQRRWRARERGRRSGWRGRRRGAATGPRRREVSQRTLEFARPADVTSSEHVTHNKSEQKRAHLKILGQLVYRSIHSMPPPPGATAAPTTATSPIPSPSVKNANTLPLTASPPRYTTMSTTGLALKRSSWLTWVNSISLAGLVTA